MRLLTIVEGNFVCFSLYGYLPHCSSESEESSDDEEVRKKTPLWAREPELGQALVNQGNLDPDAIFTSVKTCNLDGIEFNFLLFHFANGIADIFAKKRKRFKQRTSSSNWIHDRLTFQEEINYKNYMHYDK